MNSDDRQGELEPTVEVGGRIATGKFALDRARLAAFPAEAQVPDVGVLVRGKQGRGVRLSAIAARAKPDARAKFLDIESADPSFAVSVPLSEVLEHGIVLYELDGAPIAPAKGGPFRLLVCGHPDECVNVKQLRRLAFVEVRGRDTRPKDDEAHRRLHASKKNPT